jgi:hypothetical protein
MRSNAEDSVASVKGVALSFIGETNPKDFYAAVSGGEMGDGFLSRFTIIEYEGIRVKGNKERAIHTNPPEWMLKWMEAMVNTSTNYIQSNKQVSVSVRADAQALLDEYEEHARQQINREENKDRDDTRQLWNRAHLKVLKMAALMAVADNMTLPAVTEEHVTWSINLVNKDVAAFQRKEAAGEIGNGDAACNNRIFAICKEYLTKKPTPGYKIPDVMWDGNIIPRKYIQAKVANSNQFSKSRIGSVAALDKGIENMIRNGQLEPIALSIVKEMVGAGIGSCYRIINMR